MCARSPHTRSSPGPAPTRPGQTACPLRLRPSNNTRSSSSASWRLAAPHARHTPCTCSRPKRKGRAHTCASLAEVHFISSCCYGARKHGEHGGLVCSRNGSNAGSNAGRNIATCERPFTCAHRCQRERLQRSTAGPTTQRKARQRLPGRTMERHHARTTDTHTHEGDPIQQRPANPGLANVRCTRTHARMLEPPVEDHATTGLEARLACVLTIHATMNCAYMLNRRCMSPEETDLESLLPPPALARASCTPLPARSPPWRCLRCRHPRRAGGQPDCAKLSTQARLVDRR